MIPLTPNGTSVPEQLPGANITSPTTTTATTQDEPITVPYTFPRNKLKRRMTHANKIPLVLVACGSFSPITVLHIQMFELSVRYAESAGFEVVGCYLSPVSSAYQKKGLAPVHHRLKMCALAAENTDIMVDSWEALRCNEAGEPVYTRTADVLRYIDHEINKELGGIQAPDGAPRNARIVLLIGADVAMTMGDPNVWAPSDLDQILGHYGAFIVERPAQTNIEQVLESLNKYDKIWVVPLFDNDISSTKVREQLRNGETVLDVPSSVMRYIKLHDVYEGASAL